MNPFRRIADFFRRKPGMIGTPPSQRPMWHDPAAHARDFAERYFVPLDQYTTTRMAELGVPRDRIGSSDHDHGIEWCSFRDSACDGTRLERALASSRPSVVNR